MKISTNKFVSLSYDLNVGEGEEQELMERATEETPLDFIYGTGSMLEAFEKHLADLKAGDSFSFSLQPEEAYGEFNDEHIIELPKDMFIQDGVFNDEAIFEGNTVPMMDASGNRLNGTVVEIKDNEVVMDFNHPLAGEVLKFDGKVLGVREATEDELAALFMPQGGCGCGSGGCGSGGCGSDDTQKGQHGSCGCGGCSC